MKYTILVIIGLSCLISCNSQNKKNSRATNENMLLVKNTEIQDRVAFANEEYPNRVSGLKREEFVNLAFEKVLSGEFTDCYKSKNITNNEKYTLKEFKERMGVSFDTTYLINEDLQSMDTLISEKKIDLDEIIELISTEEWEYNENDLQFKKNVVSWGFVRKYYGPDDIDKEEARYRIAFHVKNTDASKPGKKIAEDFIYIFSIWNEYLLRTGFDKEKFFKFILQNVKSGKIKAYNPDWIDSRAKTVLSIDDLRNRLGELFDSEVFSNEVYQLIFIEDWYFDDETFSIKKDVKGLGFIADRKVDEEWETETLFFIFFN